MRFDAHGYGDCFRKPVGERKLKTARGEHRNRFSVASRVGSRRRVTPCKGGAGGCRGTSQHIASRVVAPATVRHGHRSICRVGHNGFGRTVVDTAFGVVATRACMNAAVEARLQAGEMLFDKEDAALLRAIDECGSLSTAAGTLGRSYSRAHTRITELESEVGPLVERQRGGADGGGSRLTSNARELLGHFVRLRTAVADTTSTEDVVLQGTVVDRDGELATVETAAGRIRALLFEDAENVEVLFRADAVTLYTPDVAPPEAGTSARNRFRGTVTTIDQSEAIADVRIAVESDVQLSVVITQQSLETLALEPGADVIATFKATATRAISKEAPLTLAG